MTNEITLVTRLEELEIPGKEAKTLLDAFGELYIDARKLTVESKGIVVTSEDQVEEMAQAKEIRIKLMKVRTEAEKIKKAIKEPYLRGAQGAQDIFNDIKGITKPEEDRLKEQENFAKLAEAKRVADRHTKRIEKLSLYVADVSVYQLSEMDDTTFEGLVADCKAVADAKKEREDQAEKELKQQKIRIEVLNSRKLELAPYKDFTTSSTPEITTETTDIEFDKILSGLKEERTKYLEEQEKLRKDKEKLEKEAEEKRVVDAKAEKVRLDKEAEVKAENDEKIRVANKAKEEAENKLKKAKELEETKLLEEKQEADRKTRLEEEEARKKLLAPDKDKLIQLATTVDMIKFPAVESADAGKVVREANQMLDEVSKFIREKAKGL